MQPVGTRGQSGRSVAHALRCAVDNVLCLAIGCAEAVDPTRDSPHQRAREERPSVATVASDRGLTSEAGNRASGHRSDEVATERAQMSPYPSALLSGLDLGDTVSCDCLDDLS